MNHSLPQRPRIVPDLHVLRRGTDQIQVGLDPRLAAVITGLPEPVAAALHQLDGRQEVDELLAGLGDQQPAMLAALHALIARGMLQDAAGQPVPLPARLAGDRAAATMREIAHGQRSDPTHRRRFAVEVRGDGRLAVAVAVQLAASGVGWVHVAAAGAVRPEDVGTGYLVDDVGRPRAEAAGEAIARVDTGVRTTTFGDARTPDLVILADSVVPEPAMITALHAAKVPHLTVRMRDGIGIVGPLVVPGRTSCTQCADLHRRDRDQHWPAIASQLVGQAQLADLASTMATSAFTVAQVLDAARWFNGTGETPATCESTVELDVFDASVDHRPWIPHPLCSCGVTPRCSDVAANTNQELRQSST